jgi:hypothetical protein
LWRHSVLAWLLGWHSILLLRRHAVPWLLWWHSIVLTWLLRWIVSSILWLLSVSHLLSLPWLLGLSILWHLLSITILLHRWLSVLLMLSRIRLLKWLLYSHLGRLLWNWVSLCRLLLICSHQEIVFLKFTAHSVVLNTLLQLYQSVIQLGVELAALFQHVLKVALSNQCFIKLLKEHGSSWVLHLLSKQCSKSRQVLLNCLSKLLTLSL